MKINELNGNVLNTKDVYIHDDVLVFLNFNRNEKMLKLHLSKYNSSAEYTIEFANVIGFTMTSCDFWGASECVLDFEYVDKSERVIIPKLEEEWLKNPNLTNGCLYDGYIETLLTFSSGDKLRIACESIEIKK